MKNINEKQNEALLNAFKIEDLEERLETCSWGDWYITFTGGGHTDGGGGNGYTLTPDMDQDMNNWTENGG